jgi:hypothetical protein
MRWAIGAMSFRTDRAVRRLAVRGGYLHETSAVPLAPAVV